MLTVRTPQEVWECVAEAMSGLVRALGFCLVVGCLLGAGPAWGQSKSSKNAAQIKALEKTLAEVRTRMSASDSYYRSIQSDLAKGIDKIERINKTADLTAALAAWPKQVATIMGSKTVKELSKNLAQDQIPNILGVTDPSWWAALGNRCYNYAKVGRFTTAKQELRQSLSNVETARINAGAEYVRRITVLNDQIRKLK